MKDGGPAFPRSGNIGETVDGMSLRDWFAGQAMIGLLSHYGDDGNTLASICYEKADAMLAEREKGGV